MDMRDYIAQRLNEMRSPAEKDMLREAMESIFIPLYDHVEGQYTELERRVKEEMSLSTSKFAIWTTIMERATANGGCPYLFPMLTDDLQKPQLELSDVQTGLKNGNEIRLDTVFLEADYLECKQLIDNKQVLNGKLLAGGREYQIGVRLRQAARYKSCIEDLYRLFISNSIPWQTMNSPYLFKLFDVMLVRIDNGEALSGTIERVTVDYGSLAPKIREGFVPVWNIHKKRIKSEDFPLVAMDKVNYEYHFDLAEHGPEHGYLADYESADIASVRRENDVLVVTSPSAKGLVWDMYKVAKKMDYVTDHFKYELMNNVQTDSFAGRMLSYYSMVVKTQGELTRVLNSYDASRFVQLDSFQIVSGRTTGETYEVNTFMIDEVRDLAVSKTMMLRFKPQIRNHILLRDEMSFLTSQVQLIYPEFHCIGVLV